MIKPHMTIAEAWYKINVEGLNPGLSQEQANKALEQINEQYKGVIAEAKKMKSKLGR